MSLRLGMSLIALSVSAMVQAQPEAETVLVKIGFAAPLSGPQAHYGVDMQHGVQLALEQLNSSPIQLGGKTVQFELFARDDQAKPDKAIVVAKELIQAELSGVLAHFNSGTSIAAASIYHAAGLPQMAMASAVAYTEQGYDTAFRMMGNDAQQGTALAQFMVKDLGATKVAVLHDNSLYGEGLSAQVLKAVEQADARIVLTESLDEEAKTWDDLHERLVQSAADAVFFAGTDRQGAAIKRFFHGKQSKWSFVTGDMGRTRLFIEQAQEAAEGTYASLSGVPLEGVAAGRRFLQEYEQRFNGSSLGYAAYAYDGMWNMVTAMQLADSSDPLVYLPHLASLKRSGVTSQNISYDRHGNLRQSPFTVYQVRKGEWRTVKILLSQTRDPKPEPKPEPKLEN